MQHMHVVIITSTRPLTLSLNANWSNIKITFPHSISEIKSYRMKNKFPDSQWLSQAEEFRSIKPNNATIPPVIFNQHLWITGYRINLVCTHYSLPRNSNISDVLQQASFTQKKSRWHNSPKPMWLVMWSGWLISKALNWIREFFFWYFWEDTISHAGFIFFQCNFL